MVVRSVVRAKQVTVAIAYNPQSTDPHCFDTFINLMSTLGLLLLTSCAIT